MPDEVAPVSVERLTARIVVVHTGYDAVTAIATQKGIVVIDAGISNRLTARYREAIEKEFGRRDFACLINTHSHADHTGGNQVFADVEIIAHENCRPEMEAANDPVKSMAGLQKIVAQYADNMAGMDPNSTEWQEILQQKIQYRAALDDWQTDRVVTFPTRTFSDSLHLNMGDVQFDLCWFGRAHSGSDILIHIPELKLLMSGDLFFPYGRPSLREYDATDTLQWNTAFGWLGNRLDKINRVISGHGRVMGRDDLVSFMEIMRAREKEIGEKDEKEKEERR